jgi:uracil-DNA glycosylase
MSQSDEWEKLKQHVAEQHVGDAPFGEGPLDARLAIVGEAPGKQEIEQGRPFVGRAGKLLDEILEEVGLDRSEIYVTNVVKLRPTTESKGRLKNRPPRAGEIKEGLEVLRSELGLVEPKVLVLLGSVPAKALIERSFTLKSNRGSWFDSQLGVPPLPTYHPAYLLRLRGNDFKETRRLVVEDLNTAWEGA